MARNNPKPTDKTEWDATGNIDSPSAGRKTSGWLFSVKPPAEMFNWFWNLTGLNQTYHNAQVQDWIVIDSDADEGDYATLVAYRADAPAADDRVLVKKDQTITAQLDMGSDVTLKFLDGAKLLSSTNIATSVLKLGSNVNIEGVLNIALSQTGVTAKAVELNGDNVTGKINVENSSTGTLTTGYHINASKTGNKIDGFIDNTGGGVLTGGVVDNSTEDSNVVVVRNGATNQIERSRGAYKFRDGLEFDLSSDADGDLYYRDAGVLKRLAKGSDDNLLMLRDGIPAWEGINWNFAAQVGNDLPIAGVIAPALAALNGTDVAFLDGFNDDLRTYRFDGTSWAQVGNDLNIPGFTFAAMTALNSTDIAFIDDSNYDLRTYRFDGTNWAQVGNDLNLTVVTDPSLTTLNGTDIAFIDGANDDLRTYRFDGADWAQVGNDLNIVATSKPSITALNSTDIAFIDDANEDLRIYRFDGANWAQVGNDLNIAGIDLAKLAALNTTDVAFIDATIEDLRIYRFDGTSWAQVGNDLNIPGIANLALAAISGSEIAFIDDTNDDLRLYRWNSSIGKPNNL